MDWVFLSMPIVWVISAILFGPWILLGFYFLWGTPLRRAARLRAARAVPGQLARVEPPELDVRRATGRAGAERAVVERAHDMAS